MASTVQQTQVQIGQDHASGHVVQTKSDVIDTGENT